MADVLHNPQANSKQPVLQIKNLDPEIIRMVRVYEAEHDLNHAQLFTRAFEALIASETANV
jgi:hypothetical protein